MIYIEWHCPRRCGAGSKKKPKSGKMRKHKTICRGARFSPEPCPGGGEPVVRVEAGHDDL